jgi:hypothetical protein
MCHIGNYGSENGAQVLTLSMTEPSRIVSSEAQQAFRLNVHRSDREPRVKCRREYRNAIP